MDADLWRGHGKISVEVIVFRFTIKIFNKTWSSVSNSSTVPSTKISVGVLLVIVVNVIYESKVNS